MITMKPILYAEDEENDAFFLKRAFRVAGITQPLVLAADGQDAIDYCSGSGRYADRDAFPLPSLVLLDLNMPRKSGIEVLRWIRTNPLSRTLPVIVFTSSVHDEDIRRAYLEGANAYLVKSPRPEELVAMTRAIKDFWLTQNRTVDRADPELFEAG